MAERVERIESRLNSVEQQLALLVRPALPPSQIPTQPAPSYLPPPRAEDRSLVPPGGPQPGSQPTAPIGPTVDTETVLKWAGVVLLVLAAVFLVSTAISRGWIGPEMQLAGATLGGFALLGASLRLRLRYHRWAGALAHGGIAVLAVCAGAAYAWLGLVPLGVTALGLVAVVALALAFAHILDDQNLVVTGLVAAVVVPLAMDAHQLVGPDLVALWLAGLVAVSLGVAGRYRWAIPRLTGLVVVGPLLAALSLSNDGLPTVENVTIQAVVVLAGFAWWLAPWHLPAPGWLQAVDHRLVMAVPGLTWLASFPLWADTDDELALVALVTVVGFVAVTAAIRMWEERPLTGPLLPTYVVGVSTLASAGLGFWLDGSALLIALTTQVVGLVWLSSRDRDVLVVLNAAVLAIVVVAWTAVGLLNGIQDGLAWADAVGYLYVIIAAIVVGVLAVDFARPLLPWIAAVTWAALLAWIAAVLGHVDQGQMLVSLIWAVLGIVVVAAATRLVPTGDLASWVDPNRLRQAGLATLAATVFKLVTVDLAEVDTIWRALLFLIVGLGLLRLGFTLGQLDRSDRHIDGATAGKAP